MNGGTTVEVKMLDRTRRGFARRRENGDSASVIPQLRSSSAIWREVMFVSAEIRWFWHNVPSAEFQHWFLSADAHGYAAGGGTPREDRYLLDPGQVELGIKMRGPKPGAEVKGLVAVLPNL